MSGIDALTSCVNEKERRLARIRELHDQLKTNQERFKQSMFDSQMLTDSLKEIVRSETPNFAEYKGLLEVLDDITTKSVDLLTENGSIQTEIKTLEKSMGALDAQITILRGQPSRRIVISLEVERSKRQN